MEDLPGVTAGERLFRTVLETLAADRSGVLAQKWGRCLACGGGEAAEGNSGFRGCALFGHLDKLALLVSLTHVIIRNRELLDL